jgi:Rrf2 family protein
VRLTAQEEYGLRCLLQMARNENGALTIREIAGREGMTTAYVAKLLGVMRRAGLVLATRGQKGGYQLARGSDKITLRDALIALGGPLYSSNFCDEHPGEKRVCVHSGDCSIRSLWAGVAWKLERLLAGIVLKDLLCSERAMGHWVEGHIDPTIGPKGVVLPTVGGR